MRLTFWEMESKFPMQIQFRFFFFVHVNFYMITKKHSVKPLVSLGDRDTTYSIVCGIVVMYAGIESIPAIWLEKREPIPT